MGLLSIVQASRMPFLECRYDYDDAILGTCTIDFSFVSNRHMWGMGVIVC